MITLEEKIFAYMKPKLMHDLMRSFSKKEIENRGFRKVLVSSITLAFCSYHGIEHTEPDAMKALQFIYAFVFDPFTIVMTEAILQRYSPIEGGNNKTNEDCLEVMKHFRNAGIGEVVDNVHHLQDYDKQGGIN